MQKVENGLFVSVEYTGTLDNGEEFDSSKGRLPLEVQIGAGNVIPGFESALMGMAVQETKTFTLAPEGSYYSVHVASFRDIGRAGSETDYLEKNGYEALVKETTVKGEAWFRVYVGEFETREEATALKLKLLDLSRIGYARVVTLKESD